MHLSGSFSEAKCLVFFSVILTFKVQQPCDFHDFLLRIVAAQQIIQKAITGSVPIYQYCSARPVPANGTGPVLACTDAWNWPIMEAHTHPVPNQYWPSTVLTQNALTKSVPGQYTFHYWAISGPVHANYDAITGPVPARKFELTLTKTVQNQYWPS